MKTHVNRVHRPVVILLGIALGFMPPAMRGQPTDPNFDTCLNNCFSVCDSGPQSLQWGCRENCGNQCASKGGSRPAIYGAIAWGTRGAQGISWNQGNWAAADQKAIADCSRYGGDCKVVYRYQNTCAALAVAKGAQHVEGATGDTEKKAEANATALCQQHWGTCASNISACSLANATASSRPAAPPQPHAASWGAIAYSPSEKQAGWASNKNDQSLAEQEAMKVCSQRGHACAVRMVFNKQCGALARDGNFVGVATAADPRETQQKALQECTKNGGSRCALQVFFCSF